MIPIHYNDALKAEYQHMFDTCVVAPEHKNIVHKIAANIAANRSRYQAIARPFGCPWYVVGLLHYEECSLDLGRHLHNGDPLSARTEHVPKGRPATGNPPFTFEQSAADALTLKAIKAWKDWSVPGVLWIFENFNGLGYRMYHPEVKSPYLWSFTNQYKSGKYVRDGHFDPHAVSQQCGLAAVLKELQSVGALS